MTIQRIASFLPSATELLYELDAQDMLYGVTHECLYPEDAKSKPRIISSVIDSSLSSRQIDEKTSQLLRDGKNIFELDEQNLTHANPDLIISQNTCEVCAAHTNQVNQAMQILKNKPQLFSMDPHNLDEILQNVVDVSKLIRKENQGNQLRNSLQNRINYLKKFSHDTKPVVLAIEWIDPFFTAGHWIPEMIEVAGGISAIGQTGDHSRRMTIDEVVKSEPDIIILMPCGFDTDRTISEYVVLQKNETWSSLRAVNNHKVYAVDANSYFSKPSIRTIIGLEILGKIIHPETFNEIIVPKNSYKLIG